MGGGVLMSEVPLYRELPSMTFERGPSANLCGVTNLEVSGVLCIPPFRCNDFSKVTSSLPGRDFAHYVPRLAGPPSCARYRLLYTGTSLTRKRTPLGPYRRPTPRVLGGPRGERVCF